MDGYTLFIVSSTLECVGALMLLAVWYFTRNNPVSNALTIASWVAFFAFVGAGNLLVSARGVLPDTITIVAGNALVCLGAGIGRLALSEMNGRPRQLALIAVPPLIWIVLCSVPAFYQNFIARAVTLSILIAFLMLWMACVALVFNRHKLQTARFLGITCAIIGMTSLLNALLYASRTPSGFLAALSDEIVFFSYFIFIILICLLITLAFAMFIELQQQHFRRQARRDPLTGLHTRAAFFDFFDRHAQSSASSEAPGSVVMIDLDHFKRANDTHGHGFGDQVLEIFGRIVREVFPPKAVAGRLGGEEFALFLPGHDAEATHCLLETLRNRLRAESARIPPTGHAITLSAGVFLSDGSAQEADHVLAIADRALYRAKANGRDRVEYANPPSALKPSA